MKKLFGIIVLTCLLSGSFAACNNDGADLPDYNDLMFNKQDREAYFEVLKAAYGPYLEDLLSSLNASLDNPKSYPGAVWAYVEGSLEKRIVTIVLKIFSKKQDKSPLKIGLARHTDTYLPLYGTVNI